MPPVPRTELLRSIGCILTPAQEHSNCHPATLPPRPAALWHQQSNRRDVTVVKTQMKNIRNPHHLSPYEEQYFSILRWGEKLVYFNSTSFQCIRVEKLLNCLKLHTCPYNYPACSLHMDCEKSLTEQSIVTAWIYWVSIDFNKPFGESSHGTPKLSTHPPTCVGCWMFARLLLFSIGGSQQLWRTGHSSPSRQHCKAEQDIPGLEPRRPICSSGNYFSWKCYSIQELASMDWKRKSCR